MTPALLSASSLRVRGPESSAAYSTDKPGGFKAVRDLLEQEGRVLTGVRDIITGNVVLDNDQDGVPAHVMLSVADTLDRTQSAGYSVEVEVRDDPRLSEMISRLAYDVQMYCDDPEYTKMRTVDVLQKYRTDRSDYSLSTVNNMEQYHIRHESKAVRRGLVLGSLDPVVHVCTAGNAIPDQHFEDHTLVCILYDLGVEHVAVKHITCKDCA